MLKAPPHRGDIIRGDVPVELTLTVAEAALRLGVSRVMLSRVVNWHAGISPNLTVRLERAGAGTARGGRAMQTNFGFVRELEKKIHEVRPLADA